jgi:hypothetical protein
MSYAYYYLYYEKSPNDKPKGAHHTPGRGVVGTLRLVDSLKPYAPEFLMSVDVRSPPKKAEKGGGVQGRVTPQTKKKEIDNMMRIDEYKSESNSPTAQKILKLGGSNKGI